MAFVYTADTRKHRITLEGKATLELLCTAGQYSVRFVPHPTMKYCEVEKPKGPRARPSQGSFCVDILEPVFADSVYPGGTASRGDCECPADMLLDENVAPAWFSGSELAIWVEPPGSPDTMTVEVQFDWTIDAGPCP